MLNKRALKIPPPMAYFSNPPTCNNCNYPHLNSVDFLSGHLHPNRITSEHFIIDLSCVNFIVDKMDDQSVTKNFFLNSGLVLELEINELVHKFVYIRTRIQRQIRLLRTYGFRAVTTEFLNLFDLVSSSTFKSLKQRMLQYSELVYYENWNEEKNHSYLHYHYISDLNGSHGEYTNEDDVNNKNNNNNNNKNNSNNNRNYSKPKQNNGMNKANNVIKNMKPKGPNAHVPYLLLSVKLTPLSTKDNLMDLFDIAFEEPRPEFNGGYFAGIYYFEFTTEPDTVKFYQYLKTRNEYVDSVRLQRNKNPLVTFMSNREFLILPEPSVVKAKEVVIEKPKEEPSNIIPTVEEKEEIIVSPVAPLIVKEPNFQEFKIRTYCLFHRYFYLDVKVVLFGKADSEMYCQSVKDTWIEYMEQRYTEGNLIYKKYMQRQERAVIKVIKSVHKKLNLNFSFELVFPKNDRFKINADGLDDLYFNFEEINNSHLNELFVSYNNNIVEETPDYHKRLIGSIVRFHAKFDSEEEVFDDLENFILRSGRRDTLREQRNERRKLGWNVKYSPAVEYSVNHPDDDYGYGRWYQGDPLPKLWFEWGFKPSKCEMEDGKLKTFYFNERRQFLLTGYYRYDSVTFDEALDLHHGDERPDSNSMGEYKHEADYVNVTVVTWKQRFFLWKKHETKLVVSKELLRHLLSPSNFHTTDTVDTTLERLKRAARCSASVNISKNFLDKDQLVADNTHLVAVYYVKYYFLAKSHLHSALHLNL